MRNTLKHWFFSLLFIFFNVGAAFNVYEFNDTNKAIRFKHLIDDLRCPKCQNNNLSDSNAPLATDIKLYVYNSVKSGKSNDEITEFLISRYGLFIVYNPKVIWLWLIPALIALVGLSWAMKSIQSLKSQAPAELPSMTLLIAEHESKKAPFQKRKDKRSGNKDKQNTLPREEQQP